MSLKKFLLAFALVMAYFGLNYAFLSDQSYDSMKDYIETTKNELVMKLRILFMRKNGQDFTLR